MLTSSRSGKTGVGWHTVGASNTQEAKAEDQAASPEATKSDSKEKVSGTAGQEDLDKAIEAKLDANDLDSLQKVIDLAKSALEKGIDEGNQEFAKQLIGASAFQKAQLLKAQISQSRLGPRSAKRIQDEIEANVTMAIEYDPKIAGAHELMATLHLISNRRDKAIESITKAIELTTDDPEEQSELYLQRAIMQTETELQLNDVSKATELNPSNTGAWQARVELLMASGNKEDAYKSIKDFLNTGTENEIAIGSAIEILLQLEKQEEALAILDEKIKAMPESSVLLRLRGQAKMRAEDDNGAIEDLSRSIELAPQDVASYLLRAQAYASMKEPKLDEAAKDVEEALTLQPGNVMGLQLRASIASLQNRFDEAIADIQLLVRHDPSNMFFLHQLAQLYQADDRPSLAIKTCDQILKQSPGEWEALRTRGDAYLSIGEQKKAIEDYEMALKKMPEDRKTERSGLLNNLSWVLSTSPKDDIRNGERALELGLEACALTEYKQAHILSTLAAAYAEKGDLKRRASGRARQSKLAKQTAAIKLSNLNKS